MIPLNLLAQPKVAAWNQTIAVLKNYKKLRFKIPAIKGPVQNLRKLLLKRHRTSWGGCSYSKEEEGNMCDELNKEIWQNLSYLGGEESRNCLIRGKELCEVCGQEKEAPHEIVINATKRQSQNPSRTTN